MFGKLFLISLFVWIISFFMTQGMPSEKQIRSELYQEPIQNIKEYKPFRVDYEGGSSNITPIADYELWGVVVSHNDPSVWYRFDITHDKKSLDTRDICVGWGENLRRDGYRKMSFFNNDYTCNYEYNKDVSYFNPAQFSNNHLITDKSTIRSQIAKINTGDQIHIKGRLVNYSEDRWNGWYRNSSTNRTDEGNGACEIIFVDSIEILSPYRSIWHKINYYAKYTTLTSVLLAVLRVFFTHRRYVLPVQS